MTIMHVMYTLYTVVLEQPMMSAVRIYTVYMLVYTNVYTQLRTILSYVQFLPNLNF